MGVVVDADTDAHARWASVAGRLRSADVELPPRIDGDGTIVRSAGLGVAVGVWIMPDNNAQGEIEDFVAKLIPEEDPVWPLAQDYIRCIPEDHQPSDTSKARLHAWLAARSKPLRMGEAIGAGDLPLKDVAVADRFVSWLRRLFEQPS